MAKVFRIVKDLERQKEAIGSELIKSTPIDPIERESGNQLQGQSAEPFKCNFNMTEQQLYQLSHQMRLFEQIAVQSEALVKEGESAVEDRITYLHPDVWRQRRERILLEARKIYE